MFFKDNNGSVTWVLCDDPVLVTGFGRACTMKEIVDKLSLINSPNDLASFLPGLKCALDEPTFNSIAGGIRKKVGLSGDGLKKLTRGEVGAISDVIDVSRFKTHTRRVARHKKKFIEEQANG